MLSWATFSFLLLLFNPVRRLTLTPLFRQRRIREAKTVCAEFTSSLRKLRETIHWVTTLRLLGVRLGVKLKRRSASAGFVRECLHTPHEQTVLRVHSAQAFCRRFSQILRHNKHQPSPTFESHTSGPPSSIGRGGKTRVGGGFSR